MSKRADFLNEHIERIDMCRPAEGSPKHLKMAISPFVFFRGSCQLFYADIAQGVLSLPERNWPLTSIMGDCHVSNFGFFTEEGSHGDRVIFAANDFDDACIGDPLWDIVRFAVSVLLSADHCQRLAAGDFVGETDETPLVAIDNATAQYGITTFLTAYIQTCEMCISDKDHIQRVFTDFDGSKVLKKRFGKAQKRAVGGRQFFQKSVLGKAICQHGNTPKFDRQSIKYASLDEVLYHELYTRFLPLMNDDILDIVERKGSGTGSVNMYRYYFLVGPKEAMMPQDLALCHIVEVKQQRAAAPIFYFPTLSPRNNLNPAHLTFRCQRQMQRNPDMLLDEVEWRGKHWLIRSRHHAKVGIDPEHIATGSDNITGGFTHYSSACGQALALAHCRGDRRNSYFAQAMHQALPKLTGHIENLANTYCEQVISDWQWLARSLPNPELGLSEQ